MTKIELKAQYNESKRFFERVHFLLMSISSDVVTILMKHFPGHY